MPNYLSSVQTKCRKLRGTIQRALDMVERSATQSGVPTRKSISQVMNVSDDMADVFREKPVIIVQTMNVQVIQLTVKLGEALTLLSDVEERIKQLVTKNERRIREKSDEKD